MSISMDKIQNSSTSDLLLEAAEKYVEKGELKKAAALLESAAMIFPNNISIKIRLGKIQAMLNEKESSERNLIKDPEIRCSLAQVLLKMGMEKTAKSLLNKAMKEVPTHYLPFFTAGLINYEDKNFIKAARLFERACELNPFHEESSNYLALAHYHAGNLNEALSALIDAYLLSGEFKKAGPGTYRQRIRILMEEMPYLTQEQKKVLFKARKERFEKLYDAAMEEIGETGGDILLPPLESPPPMASSKTRALDALTSGAPLTASLPPSAMEKLASCANEITLKPGDTLWRAGEIPSAVVVCITGTLNLDMTTPWKKLTVRTIETGGFAGEEHFMGNKPSLLYVNAPQGARVLLLNRDRLRKLFTEDKDLALHFLWFFYKNTLRSILHFQQVLWPHFEEKSKNSGARTEAIRFLMDAIHTSETPPLTLNDMAILEKSSCTISFKQGDVIYKEGSEAPGLMVLLEGSVTLSRGMDNDVLALVEKGNSIAETALFSGMTMKETAVAFDDPTKTAVINRDTCAEVLKGDKEQSYLFLSILCRILSERLLNETYALKNAWASLTPASDS